METVANSIAPVTKYETGRKDIDAYYKAMSLFGLLTEDEKKDMEARKKNG